ncbi:hypothetical protein GGR50DRAFT_488478 [Xylaria sp. CBS 124048]|nr:hypothetical protein GGR50DRAFT_488478 [Xylaria sp. CBS 124048]
MATEHSPTPPNLDRGLISTPSIGEPAEPEPVQFRGFDFFANRDLNHFRDASRAYFAEKQVGVAASWLGDATPPASARPSVEGSSRELRGWRQPPVEKRILGIRQRLFWTLLATLLIVVVVAVGVGVGVGVGTQGSGNGSKSADLNGANTAQGAANSTVTSSAHATGTRSAPTATTTGGPQASHVSFATCPGVNGTIYDPPGSSKKFLRLCGVDFDKKDGAVDIENMYLGSPTDCIDKCAAAADCTGCGWGVIAGDNQGSLHRCWLKNNLTDNKPHVAEADWYFASLT